MSEIRLERGATGVVTITIDRQHRRNAVTLDGWVELHRLFLEAARDTATRVLVLTGAGRSFCSGADLVDGLPPEHPLHVMQTVNAAALALHELPKPTIAMVNGDAAGGGMNLALCCDLVVAGESARFTQSFVRRALVLDFGGSWLLPRLVGVQKAKELAYLGDILSARDAHALGLVNRVVPDADLDGFVRDWAERIAAGPPLALRLDKKLLAGALQTGFAEALDAEAAAQSVNLVSQDGREGFAAFRQKRAPVFRGR